MTTVPSISVVIVSWQRPDTLRRCLLGLQQQDHPALEVCLVADTSGQTVLESLRGTGLDCRFAANPGGNISLARNIGLQLAAGDVVAYIDDDAVAEPTWASRLARAFLIPEVVAATGYTIGRNGISLQWAATETDATGQDHPLPISPDTRRHKGTQKRAVKPVGTNCAFRRSALLAVGGFDPAYRFYLEDADMGLRLAPHGLTAVVPEALVHHAFAASSRRAANRVPTDLTEIGASTMVFLRRHAAASDVPATLARLRAEQAARLLVHQQARRLSMADVARLTATLEAGIKDGANRPLSPLAPFDTPQPPAFLRLPGTGPKPGKVIAGRIWRRARLLDQAAKAAAAGQIVTVICMSPTPRAHRMQFTDQGFWLQTGGLFGRSTRQGPRLRLFSLKKRIAQETARVAAYRPIF